jgi:glycosyltransferase involved in cell wall biosynthesis
VQLRDMSRGETSAALLDCLNYGLPTIVNAHGSMADLQDGAVTKLPDIFSDVELIDALETLWRDKELRDAISMRALKIMRAYHAPEYCAALYASAIDKFYEQSATDVGSLTQALAKVMPIGADDRTLAETARAVSHSIAISPRLSQLLVDVSNLVNHDDGTGIPRVVRSILHEWIKSPPPGFRVEPVYASVDQNYRYARRFTLNFLGCPVDGFTDDPIEFQAGDHLVVLDLQHYVVIAQEHYYQKMRQQGVRVQFLIYDLLPVLMPDCFIEAVTALHPAWLKVVAKSDGVICISKAVADEFAAWRESHRGELLRPLDVDWFHLGSDVKASMPSKGLPRGARSMLEAIKAKNTFLMIGTIEPRKGHAQVIAAFENLWANGNDAILVIVGKQGWMVESIMTKLRNHAERDKRLIWLEGISDEYLEEVYAAGTCLIAASEGEGFGLPLIEAAQHKLPILARDIPVFREVAGNHAYYFSGKEPQVLTDALIDWLRRFESGSHPKSAGMRWLTWKQSADQLLQLVVGSKIRVLHESTDMAAILPTLVGPDDTAVERYSMDS